MTDNKQREQHEAQCDSSKIKIEPANIATGIPFDIVYIKEDNIECEVENVPILEEKPVKIENHAEEFCSELNTSKRKCGYEAKQNSSLSGRLTLAGPFVLNSRLAPRIIKRPVQKSSKTGKKSRSELNKSQFLTNRLTKGYQRCGICNLNFYSQSEYETHKRMHAKEVRNLQIENGNLLIGKTQCENRCGNCGKIFQARQLLNLHATICKKLSESVKKQLITITTMQTESPTEKKIRRTYECGGGPKSDNQTIGGRITVTKKLTMQTESPTEKKIQRMYECGGGPKSDNQTIGGRRLVRLHGEPFACDTCGKQFKNRNFLTNHKTTHEC